MNQKQSYSRKVYKMDDYWEIDEAGDEASLDIWVGRGAYSSTYRISYMCWLVIAGLISLGIYVGSSVQVGNFQPKLPLFLVFFCVLFTSYVWHA